MATRPLIIHLQFQISTTVTTFGFTPESLSGIN